MSLKNIVRIIILLPTLAYCVYCCCYFATHRLHDTYKDCGKVMSKSSDEVTIKNGVSTELYLNIQFDKSGFQSIRCTPSTYFFHKVGDNACFHLNKEDSHEHIVYMVVGACCFFALGLFGISFIVLYIMPD